MSSARAELIAAFLLGGLIALLFAAPGHAAEAFRLDRLAVVHVSPTDDGRLALRAGVLDLTGEVAWRGTQTIPRPASVPEWALNRHLVNVNAWLAFHNLGGAATANFEVQAGGVQIWIGDQVYMAVGLSPDARMATGPVINLSTRTHLRGEGDTVIAGFVIEDRPRAVLVRAIGPGLRRFDVANAHPDPWLAIKRGKTTITGNDDWELQPNAQLVRRAAARVGAFPLDPGSFDAAQLVILPPGAYTVHVSTERTDVTDGEILLEIYTVPEDVFEPI